MTFRLRNRPHLLHFPIIPPDDQVGNQAILEVSKTLLQTHDQAQEQGAMMI